MEQELTTIRERLEQLEKKIDAVHAAMERIQRYFQIAMWVTLAVVVLPALGLIVVIPSFINTYTSMYEGLL